MKRLLTLLLTLTACGHEDGAKQAAATTAPVATARGYSIALNTLSEMPACTADNETQLAYVAEVQLFYVCTSTRWTEVAIKGADGKDGTAGAAGTNGKDGVDGVDGAPLPANEWIDPLTGMHWIVGGATTAALGVRCGKGRAPTNEEAVDAVAHGIFVAFPPGINDMWTATGQVLNVANAYAPTSGAHGNFCIKEIK